MDIVEKATLDDLITVRGLNSLLKIIDVRNFY